MTTSEPREVERIHPVADPGVEHHVERWTDVDEAAANRVTRQITFMFGMVPLLCIAFVVFYFAIDRSATVDFAGLHAPAQHTLIGLAAGMAILLVGVGAVQWARLLMNDHEQVEERHDIASSDDTRKEAVAQFSAGVEDSGIGRRKMIGTSLAGALGILAVPALVMFADMGPWPGPGMRRATIERTVWAEGVHLVTDVTYNRIKAAEMEIGQLINAQPEVLKEMAHDDPIQFQREKAKASIIIVKMDPNRIKVPKSRTDWHVGGILCYSKICTHVGCPISLWEQQTHHLLCPCHQSTFDLGNSGVVVFGPAARSLPQLPIKVDAQGFLVAQRDFDVPVGPSYFERDSSKDYQDGDE